MESLYPKLTPEQDKRRKLSASEHDYIRKRYADRGRPISHRQLAREYGVSKRLIQFILNPEKQAIAKRQYRERQKTGIYYSKEKQREYMRTHRQNIKDAGNHKAVLQWSYAVRKARGYSHGATGTCPHCGKVLEYLRAHINRMHMGVVQ